MQIIYKGNQAVVSFEVAGQSIKLTPNIRSTITDEQAKSLLERSYINALVEKGLIEFTSESVEPSQDETNDLDELNKDELLELAEKQGLDIPVRTAKAEIIKAIDEARK